MSDKTDRPGRRPTPAHDVPTLVPGTPPANGGEPPYDNSTRDGLLRKVIRRVERIDREVDILLDVSNNSQNALQSIRADREVICSDINALVSRLNTTDRKIEHLKNMLVKLLSHNGISIPEM